LFLRVCNYYSVSALVTTEFNQLTALSSSLYRIIRLPSNLVTGQEITIWSMVWGSPHEQIGDFVSPHLYMKAFHVPWPVWKRFNSDHEQRGRLKPGCLEVGSSTIAQLVTEADGQSSLYCEFMSTGDKSNQMGCRDESRWDGWVKKHQHELASLDGCLFYTTSSCLQLTSDAGLLREC